MIEPMTAKALRRRMGKPAVDRPLGDPSQGELLLRYIKTFAEVRARRREHL